VSSSFPPGGPGGPEYLDSHDGASRQPLPRPTETGTGRRTGLVAGGVVGVLAVGAAGAWAAWSFFSTGAQPAEALPVSTIAYISVDLDPSGGQKIEALQTLRKFPAFKEHVGLETDDDVRKRVFEEMQKSSGCEDLDYDDDIAPWLGDRMALAAVDAGGKTPDPVLVLQVTDEDAADQGLQKLRDCGGDGGAWTINGGWALVGESQGTLEDIAADAADAPLSDDDDYTTWTDKAGDPGIATAYVAPEAGAVLADNLDSIMSELGRLSATGPGGPELSDGLQEFGGLAATVRFDDGALEIEVAADSGKTREELGGADRGDDVLATLPDDTAAAFGAGFVDGWFDDVVEQMAAAFGEGTSAEEMMDELSQASGLDLPDDAETLVGESAALAVGGDFDPETFANSGDGSGVPVGLKVKGDAGEIETVLEKLRTKLGPDASFFDSSSDGDVVAIGPDEDYRAQLIEDGDLGGSEVFQNVVREAGDAAVVYYVNFDITADWLDGLTGDDAVVAENLAPLQGLGVSSWLDDDATHGVLRITTD
jgi:hypothetical protein